MNTTKRAIPRLLLKPREAAEALAISEKSLYTYTRDGLIPVVTIGRSKRYALADLEAWIAAQKENP